MFLFSKPPAGYDTPIVWASEIFFRKISDYEVINPVFNLHFFDKLFPITPHILSFKVEKRMEDTSHN